MSELEELWRYIVAEYVAMKKMEQETGHDFAVLARFNEEYRNHFRNMVRADCRARSLKGTL